MGSKINFMKTFNVLSDKLYVTEMIRILTRKIYEKFHYLILYGIFGCISAGLDFVIFTLLVKTGGLGYIISNCISVLAGIITSFLLNRSYNFKVKNHTTRRFVIFLTVGLCGMMLSNVILWICIDKIMMDKIIAKLLSIFLVVFFQFLLNRYVTFRIPRNMDN